MEIILRKEHLTGSDLYHRWEELEKIYVSRAETSNIILSAISNYFQMKKENITGKSQKGNYVRARQIYCGLMRILSDYGLVEIGQEINRCHGTVSKLVEKFNNYYCNEESYRKDVHSVAVKMNIEHQEKIYNYLKEIK